jgi:hypothetical protein
MRAEGLKGIAELIGAFTELFSAIPALYGHFLDHASVRFALNRAVERSGCGGSLSVVLGRQEP